MKAWVSLNFAQTLLGTAELAALERLEYLPKTCNGRNVVAILAFSFFI